ncbi:transposase [Sorangium sp. So ce887]
MERTPQERKGRKGKRYPPAEGELGSLRDFAARGGGTASGGASGGAGAGGAASGGAASGGAASGGANGSGGAQPDPDGAGEEFLLSFPRRNVFGLGQPLAATRNGSVITVGARAPAELLPDSIDEPFLAEYSATGEVLHALALPGAAEPELMTIDAEGSIVLVGQLYMDMTFGEFTLTTVEEGEVLEFVPAQFRILAEQREKLACPRCPEQGVTTADSEKVMDRGRPGPGLLASIIVEKFEDAMPLYRQAQQYARFGVSLSPSTLGEWSAFALDVLAPVAKRIQERVLGACYVRADDTGMRVLDRDHPAGVKRGHMWAFVGAELVTFVYAPDWQPKHPAALLQGFTGYLQGDGYAGYAAMLRGGDDGERIVPEERRLGCGMHISATRTSPPTTPAREVYGSSPNQPRCTARRQATASE